MGCLWAAGALWATRAGGFGVRAAREGAHNVGAPSSPLPKTEAAEKIDKPINPLSLAERGRRRRAPTDVRFRAACTGPKGL